MSEFQPMAEGPIPGIGGTQRRAKRTQRRPERVTADRIRKHLADLDLPRWARRRLERAAVVLEKVARS